MKEQFDLHVELELNTELLMERTPQKIFLFRAVQELLFNIFKHAGIKEAEVEVASSEDSIIVCVSDHGRGFDPKVLHATGKSGFGLLTIQERASYIGGAFSIESAPGQGSRFTLTVPNAAMIEDNLPEPNSPVDPRSLAAEKIVIDMGLKTTRVLFADNHKIMRQGLVIWSKLSQR